MLSGIAAGVGIGGCTGVARTMRGFRLGSARAGRCFGVLDAISDLISLTVSCHQRCRECESASPNDHFCALRSDTMVASACPSSRVLMSMRASVATPKNPPPVFLGVLGRASVDIASVGVECARTVGATTDVAVVSVLVSDDVSACARRMSSANVRTFRSVDDVLCCGPITYLVSHSAGTLQTSARGFLLVLRGVGYRCDGGR
ncbi:MAG: hypothetical protein RLZZ234_751 [Candidatus Parcubacteria bacterium]